MSPGDLLEVHATDPGSVADFQGWSKTSKTAILKRPADGDKLRREAGLRSRVGEVINLL